MKRGVKIGVAAVLGAGALAPVARAETVRVLATDASVVVALPANAPAPGNTLQIELDGYDVTAVSTVADGNLTIPLPGLALTPGEHYLLVLAAGADGDVDTLAEHTLDVYQRAGRREASQQWNLLLSNNYRFAQHPDAAFDGTSRSAGNGALQWAGKFDGGTWIASGGLDLLYDSASPSMPGQKRMQMPAIELRVGRRIGSGSVGLAFGDGAVNPGSLIFSGFDRRGLRLEASALDQRFTAQAFTLHPDPVTNFDADVPPFDSSSNVVGAQTVLAPFSLHPGALTLSAGWLDGDSTLGGVGIVTPQLAGDAPLTYGGNAWTLALDSFAFERALWMHGEYAASRFDSDGQGAGVAARDDHARRFVAQLSSGGALTLPAFEQWTLGFEWQQVGAHFFSLGNLLLPGDLDLQQGYASLATHGVSLDGALLRQHTDVAGGALTPRIDSNQQNFTAAYTPPSIDPAASPWRWLGVPSLSLGYEATSNEQDAVDLLLAGYDLDNRQRTISAGLSFAHQHFSFGLNADRVQRRDLSQALIVDDFVLYEPGPDSRETLFGVNVAWLPNERFTISPQWQRSRVRETPDGSRTDNDLWSLQLQASLIREVLSLQLGWSDTQDRQRLFELPQQAQRLSSNTGNLDLAYRMRTPDAIWPGVNFNLRAAYGRSLGEQQWQAMLSFELNWKQER